MKAAGGADEEDEEENDDDEDGRDLPEEAIATGHFQEEQFLEEVANSKKLADEFEKNFQKHREAFRQSQAVDENGDGEPSEQTEMPDFVAKAAMNDRVIPKDDEDVDAENRPQNSDDRDGDDYEDRAQRNGEAEGETEGTVLNDKAPKSF